MLYCVNKKNNFKDGTMGAGYEVWREFIAYYWGAELTPFSNCLQNRSYTAIPFSKLKNSILRFCMFKKFLPTAELKIAVQYSMISNIISSLACFEK